MSCRRRIRGTAPSRSACWHPASPCSRDIGNLGLVPLHPFPGRARKGFRDKRRAEKKGRQKWPADGKCDHVDRLLVLHLRRRRDGGIRPDMHNDHSRPALKKSRVRFAGAPAFWKRDGRHPEEFSWQTICYSASIPAARTDAALYSETRGVVARAKALTTRHDLAVGISGAVEAVLRRRAPVSAIGLCPRCRRRSPPMRWSRAGRTRRPRHDRLRARRSQARRACRRARQRSCSLCPVAITCMAMRRCSTCRRARRGAAGAVANRLLLRHRRLFRRATRRMSSACASASAQSRICPSPAATSCPRNSAVRAGR